MGIICGNLKSGRNYKKFCIQNITKYRIGNVEKYFPSRKVNYLTNQLYAKYILRLSKQEKELLYRFIEEERLDTIDTVENIISDICRYRGFAMNMYKRVVDKIILLPDVEECNDNDYERLVFYGKLLDILE